MINIIAQVLNDVQIEQKLLCQFLSDLETCQQGLLSTTDIEMDTSQREVSKALMTLRKVDCSTKLEL